jgi:hypothetical protein
LSAQQVVTSELAGVSNSPSRVARRAKDFKHCSGQIHISQQRDLAITNKLPVLYPDSRFEDRRKDSSMSCARSWSGVLASWPGWRIAERMDAIPSPPKSSVSCLHWPYLLTFR